MEHLSSDHQGESQRIGRMVREVENTMPSTSASVALVTGIFAAVLGSAVLATPDQAGSQHPQFAVQAVSKAAAKPAAQNPQQRIAKAIDQGADLNKLLEATAAGYADTFHSQFSAEIERAEVTELPPTF